MTYMGNYRMQKDPDAYLPDYMEEPKAVYACAWCGEDICDGDEYYELPNGDIVCADCIADCKHTAEADEEDEDPWEDSRVEAAIERWKGID